MWEDLVLMRLGLCFFLWKIWKSYEFGNVRILMIQRLIIRARKVGNFLRINYRKLGYRICYGELCEDFCVGLWYNYRILGFPGDWRVRLLWSLVGCVKSFGCQGFFEGNWRKSFDRACALCWVPRVFFTPRRKRLLIRIAFQGQERWIPIRNPGDSWGQRGHRLEVYTKVLVF